MKSEEFAPARKVRLTLGNKVFRAAANSLLLTFNFSFFIFHFSFFISSCTGHPDEVRLEGEFANIEQGEFLI